MHTFWFGAYEADAFFLAADRKYRVFRNEAISGMYSLCTGEFGRFQDPFQVQVAFLRRCLSYMNGLVGQINMESVFVGGRVDSDGGDTELTACTDDTTSYFAPVGDQDFSKQASYPLGEIGLAAWRPVGQSSGRHRGASGCDP